MIRTRSSGAVVRAFFALEPSEAAREACAATAAMLGGASGGDGVRWVKASAYHLTLRFLGNVEQERLPELSKCVTEKLEEVPPFAFSLGSVGGFPSPRRPRVVAAVAEPGEALEALAARVEQGVREAGLPAETRRFRPHLTLGRVRHRRLPALDGVSVRAPATLANEVVLFRSDLRREGAFYTVLERVALGGTPGADTVSP